MPPFLCRRIRSGIAPKPGRTSAASASVAGLFDEIAGELVEAECATLAETTRGLLPGGLVALSAAERNLVFAIMRPVGPAHGDPIVAAAFVIVTLVAASGPSPFRPALPPRG